MARMDVKREEEKKISRLEGDAHQRELQKL